MGERERIVVEVEAEVADALREAVALGQHDSVGAAAQDALDAWYFDRVAPWLSDEDLGRMWDEAIASDEPAQDGPEAMAEIKAWLESHIASLEDPGASPGASPGVPTEASKRRA